MQKIILALLISLAAITSQAKLTFDVGYSFGESNDQDYSELNLGVNYFFSDLLVWRNSGFHRNFSNDQIEDRYGLDTSIRLNLVMDVADAGSIKLFGGPGWRFQSEGKNPPLAEAGIGIDVGGLRVGAGAKMIFNEIIDSNQENDTQYFVSISGSGSIGD